MVLLYIACAVLVAVAVYLALLYYFLFCKEKPLRERPGIFTVSDPDVYFPKPKKKSSVKKLAAASLFVAPKRKHNDDNKSTNIETNRKAIDNPDAVLTSGALEEMSKGERHICEPEHVREEKCVRFEDEVKNQKEDHDSCTYVRSEAVDHGYGTLTAGGESGNTSWSSD